MRQKENVKSNQWELIVKAKRGKKAGNQLKIGFSFESDWLRNGASFLE